MQKVIVIGCPGSGKSTFSRALHQKTGIPLFHLDMMYWNADRTIVEKPVFLDRLDEVLKQECWIIDGNYASTMEKRMLACDTVIYLDYPLDVCIEGIRERRGKERTDMPWIELEEDAEFMEYVRTFNAEQKPGLIALLEQYSDKDIYIFKSREEANAFLESI